MLMKVLNADDQEQQSQKSSLHNKVTNVLINSHNFDENKKTLEFEPS